jgi:hypothetical protein
LEQKSSISTKNGALHHHFHLQNQGGNGIIENKAESHLGK